ncbi:MAG: hypothetical protein ACR2LT_08970 [Pyrinomonadaceae bacterium]
MEQNETTATAEAVETTTENTNEDAEPEIAAATETVDETMPAATEEAEEISYHAVEKDGHITAIWEMQGRKHLRTIDPRSAEGKHIMSLFTSEHHEEAA